MVKSREKLLRSELEVVEVPSIVVKRQVLQSEGLGHDPSFKLDGLLEQVNSPFHVSFIISKMGDNIIHWISGE